MNTSRTEKEKKADFLNQFALFILSDSPLKSNLHKYAEGQRGKLLAQLTPEQRSIYLKAKQILVSLADKLAKANDVDRIAKVLSVVQSIGEGDVWEYANPNDEAISKGVKDLLFEECNLILDNDTTARLISIVRGVNPV
ncbi:hypothetical protein FAES_3754 [Fibrella aestuarina BUZ 2]|uniref:Uncharacterized protein n=1 Tax=Fibrella aestuarina BUZ 2 TaxID=1166018 RepID=I0KCA8_9BACT|nr:hypothetical protein [Fibrella aestuarina]CCH01761.1 hypothetical protein FAES_3754 [Fibrella aestuarina BUZ 2]